MIDEPCWEVGFSYGETLYLDIGGKVEIRSKLSKFKKYKGLWILENNSNYWELYRQGEEIPVGEMELDEATEKLQCIVDTTITGFDLSYPELVLTLSFSNGCELKLFPEDDEYDLPYWELLTPYTMILEFGPHRTWSYKRSDIPIGEEE